MNLSTDLYPSFSKLFLEYPFHFLRLSFDDAFFSWMAPLTTTNSTSVSGPSPNSSRISFGIVTWPRSPIFILLSMYQESYSVNIYYNEESPPLATTPPSSAHSCSPQSSLPPPRSSPYHPPPPPTPPPH